MIKDQTNSFAFVLGALGTLIFGVAHAQETPTSRRNRGVIVYQSKEFESFSTEKQFAKIISRARRQNTLQRDANGSWPFHFMAFMKTAPGSTNVNLVWYKLGKGKPEQIDFTEFTVSPNELTLRAQSVIRPEQGFTTGSQYEARITRLVDGKEVVYARCKVKLK
ncbi:MAG: hypothetical protein V1754_10210 [Pseudomonadota bacterium]